MNYFHLILRRFGADESRREMVLRGLDLGTGELENPGLELTFAQQTRLSDNLNDAFGEEWILDVPEVWGPASQGALGMAVLSAATLGEAVRVMADYTTVHTHNYHIAISRGAEQIAVRHSLPPEYPRRQVWTVTASVFLAISRMLQMLIGQARSQVSYEFKRSRPDYAVRFEKMLAGPVRWRAGANAAIIPKSLLDVRSPLADPVSHEAALRLLEYARRAKHAPHGVRDRVENLLADAASGRLSIAGVARTLGLSQRTLIRRLSASDVSFRELVEAELKARARRLLDAGVLSRAEIAERLGFADATGFSRACRRWFKAAS